MTVDYETAMAKVDTGLSAEREGWEPEYGHYPEGVSAWYWVAELDGKRHQFLGTECVGAYNPTDADLAATDWEVY